MAVTQKTYLLWMPPCCMEAARRLVRRGHGLKMVFYEAFFVGRFLRQQQELDGVRVERLREVPARYRVPVGLLMPLAYVLLEYDAEAESNANANTTLWIGLQALEAQRASRKVARARRGIKTRFDLIAEAAE